MKQISSLLGLSTALVVNQLSAQVEVTITGSTAFRAITIDRVASLYDSGYNAVTNNASTGLQTYRGTMAGAIPSLANVPVTVRLSFSGSAAGMQSVQAQTPI